MFASRRVGAEARRDSEALWRCVGCQRGAARGNESECGEDEGWYAGKGGGSGEGEEFGGESSWRGAHSDDAKVDARNGKEWTAEGASGWDVGQLQQWGYTGGRTREEAKVWDCGYYEKGNGVQLTKKLTQKYNKIKKLGSAHKVTFFILRKSRVIISHKS